MADILSSLLAFPPDKKGSIKEWDKQASDFASHLSKVNSATWIKPVNKQNILDLLNPALNTLPYLFALFAQCGAAGKDRARAEEAVTRSTIFFTSFDPVQARYAGDVWRMLIEWAIDVYPKLGVRDFTPISTAMLRLDPTVGTFTSTHLRFLRLCLDCAVPSQALPIIDKNIYAFPQATPKGVPDEPLCDAYELSNGYITARTGFTLTPLKSDWILEYYLLGAHIYIGMRNYSRARLFLEYLILAPTSNHSCSALQVEAYKKWLLVGLLAQGKSYGLPRTHDVQVMKSMRSVSRAYEALAEDFERRDSKKYQAEMDAGVQIWHEDGNQRLVQEAGNALLRYRVIDLQNTYAVLPVSRVAAHLELPEDITLRMLDDMQRQGHLNAQLITPAAGSSDGAVLHFNATPTGDNAEDFDLEAQTKRIEDLVTFVRDADRRLQLTKEYVEYSKRGKRSAMGPDGDLAEQMELDWDNMPAPVVEEDGDEDIMAS